MKPHKETRILFVDNQGNRQWLRCRDFERHRYWRARGFKRTKIRVRITIENPLIIYRTGRNNGGKNYSYGEVQEICEKEFQRVKGDYGE